MSFGHFLHLCRPGARPLPPNYVPTAPAPPPPVADTHTVLANVDLLLLSRRRTFLKKKITQKRPTAGPTSKVQPPPIVRRYPGRLHRRTHHAPSTDNAPTYLEVPPDYPRYTYTTTTHLTNIHHAHDTPIAPQHTILPPRTPVTKY